MARTEFHGQNNKDADRDPDYFGTRHVGLARSPSQFSVTCFPQSDTVRLVARDSISELSSEDLDLLIQSLQEAQEYLDRT